MWIQKAGSGNPENLDNTMTLNLHKSKGNDFLPKPLGQTDLDDHTSNQWFGHVSVLYEISNHAQTILHGI